MLCFLTFDYDEKNFMTFSLIVPSYLYNFREKNESNRFSFIKLEVFPSINDQKKTIEEIQ